jgi:hypothetical protein
VLLCTQISKGAVGSGRAPGPGELGMGWGVRREEAVRAERCSATPRSMHPVLSSGQDTAFDGMDFGANPGGIYVAAGPDRMHVLLEGLGKNLATFTCKLAEQDKTEAELDQRYAHMAKTGALRCGAVETSEQSTKFAAGISHLHYQTAHEVLPMLLQLPVVLGVDQDIIKSAESERKVHEALRLYLCVCRSVWCEQHTLASLAAMEVQTDEFLAAVIAAFPDGSGSDFK